MRHWPWSTILRRGAEALAWAALLAGLAKILVWSQRNYPAETPMAFGTLLLGVGTLGLARVTLLLAGYTRTYAKHTKALVEATQSAMRSQLRPVVGLRNLGDDVYPYNFGIGPAMNVEVRRSVLPLEGVAKPHEITPDWPGLLCLGPKEGTPDVAKFVWKVTPSGEPVPGITVNHVFTKAEIVLHYSDVFGQRFEMSLCKGNWEQREI